MTVKIIADSTCDLPRDLAEKYDIEIVPLHILLEDSSYEDGFNITPDDIYRWSDAHKATPTTSAPGIAEVMKSMEKFYRQYDQIVCFTIAATMSGTFNVFRLAAEELEISSMVYIINSKNLSTGISLMVVKAALMAAEGKDGQAIFDEMLQYRKKIRTSFVVDTLTYLHRGGRCSGLASMAGSALHLHPVIAVADSAMHPGKKYRGSLEHVYPQYLTDLDPMLKNADKERVFVTYSGDFDDSIKKIMDLMKQYGFREIIPARAGGVISSHCGPGAMGVVFAEQ